VETVCLTRHIWNASRDPRTYWARMKPSSAQSKAVRATTLRSLTTPSRDQSNIPHLPIIILLKLSILIYLLRCQILPWTTIMVKICLDQAHREDHLIPRRTSSNLKSTRSRLMGKSMGIWLQITINNSNQHIISKIKRHFNISKELKAATAVVTPTTIVLRSIDHSSQ